MTEEEWLGNATPGWMLRFLGDSASGRKLWLFTCNCVEFVWQSLLQGEIAPPLELAWAAADGLVSQSNLATPPRVGQQPMMMHSASKSELAEWFAGRALDVAFRQQELRVVEQIRRDVEALAVLLATKSGQDTATDSHAARIGMTSLLRDIFGNPFHPITLDPSWLTSTVVSLARQIYDSRDFTAMPILADALQDAGCDNPQIVEHCQGPGSHVRGCWVCDLCLNKS